MSFLTKIFGSSNQRSLKRMQIIVDRINNLESEYQKLSDDELSSLRDKFRNSINDYTYDVICHVGDNFEHNVEISKIISKYGDF